MANSNFTSIIAMTLQNFSNKILDNIITNNSTLYFLQQKGNIKVVGGGRQFIEQLLYKTNSSFAARGGLDTITTPVTDAITASEWDIKVVSGSIVLPALDVAKNSGSKEKLLDYAKAKALEAEVSMGEVLGDQLYNTAVGANDFDSIARIISEDASTETINVGGINGSASSYWRNYSYDTVVGTFNVSQNGWNAIDTSINQATFGRMGPKLMVTTKAIYTLCQLGLTSLQRYTTVPEKGSVGFKTLEYAGIPIVFDDNCPSGNLYGIDTDAIKLKVLAQGNLRQTPFQMKYDQLAEAALLYIFGNITCNSRRTNFVIDSITG
jgi:hypothetical protein